MQHYENCPRCGNAFSEKHRIGQGLVCDCGWTHSGHAEAREHNNLDQTSAIIILAAGLLIGGIFHAVNWDTHFFSVIPLKVKQWTNTASIADYDRLALICEERHKHSCIEAAYTAIEKQDPRNLINLSRLGILQAKSERWHHAAKTFAKYFKLQGRDVEAAFEYAKVLTQLKKYTQAEHYYKYVLQQRPRVLQVSVVRTYVQMLMTANRLQQAKYIILTHRKKSASANYFMSKELDDIRQRLGEVKISASQANKPSPN